MDNPQLLRKHKKLWALNEQIKNDLAGADVEFFSVLDALCKAGRCVTKTDQGIPVSWDYGHFTVPGALFTLEKLKIAGLEF